MASDRVPHPSCAAGIRAIPIEKGSTFIYNANKFTEELQTHIKKFAGTTTTVVTYVPGVGADDGFLEWADGVIIRVFENESTGAGRTFSLVRVRH
ncbi:uncharacterized protein FIBRA_00335 [Fibroporia radiculosa]|uniref:Uncharacterized protein n=1 Tax=Fibroporia radiculosa TaxID=599839 RepID=J7SC16_9APHY|nr:uncharacterized protein FIBRA_00335 [Fibroporia radiculosa]CCL98341.1 predicted protein [Fibroporia radiculosa]